MTPQKGEEEGGRHQDRQDREAEALRARREAGLELERRRVGVRAEDPERRRGGAGIGLHPCDDGTVAHHDPPAGPRRPLVPLLEPLEPRGLEAGDGVGQPAA